MMGDLYPGKKFSHYECCEMCIGWCYVLQGLDKSPKILVDTMLPNISPDRVAKASVLVNGGYNKCQYRVSKLVFLICYSALLTYISLPRMIAVRKPLPWVHQVQHHILQQSLLLLLL